MIAAAFTGPSLARLAVALFLAAGSGAHAAGTLQTWTAGPPPPLVLNDLDGRRVRLDQFAGRTVLVNFWATWCAPCVAELPSLQRLRDRLAVHGVDVVAVNYQENAARIRPFVERLGFNLTVVRDHDGTVRKAWNVGVFPTTFVVGPDQRIVWWAQGEIDWDDPRVESRIRTLL